MVQLTKREEAARDFASIVGNFDVEMTIQAAREGKVPDTWRDVWRMRTAKKEKVSFWVDADVARFFRGLGPGYGPRMASVLRGFVLARMAGFVTGARLPEHMHASWMDRGPGPNEVTVPLETVEMAIRLLEKVEGKMGKEGKGE